MFAFTLTLTILATIKVAVIFFCFVVGFLAAIFDVDVPNENDITALKVVKFLFSFILSLGIGIWGWIIILF